MYIKLLNKARLWMVLHGYNLKNVCEGCRNCPNWPQTSYVVCYEDQPIDCRFVLNEKAPVKLPGYRLYTDEHYSTYYIGRPPWKGVRIICIEWVKYV